MKRPTIAKRLENADKCLDPHPMAKIKAVSKALRDRIREFRDRHHLDEDMETELAWCEERYKSACVVICQDDRAVSHFIKTALEDVENLITL